MAISFVYFIKEDNQVARKEFLHFVDARDFIVEYNLNIEDEEFAQFLLRVWEHIKIYLLIDLKVACLRLI
jgi:hypothetical protein